MRESGSNRVLHFLFDSDGDADPDTDACGTGSRPQIGNHSSGTRPLNAATKASINSGSPASHSSGT
jgi:hypothetical protein